MNRKIWKALGIAVCMLALAAPRAMAETNSHYVSDGRSFKKAIETINNSKDKNENEIVLMNGFTLEGDTTEYTLRRGTTTIKGEGNTITVNPGAGIKVTGEKTVLNLGAEGYAEKLTIDGNAKGAFITVSGGATAHMYENVTLQNRQQVDQACVVLEENSVFNMHGGVIQNCKGKYGGVSLKNGSRFIMEGGIISECSAVDGGGGLYAKNKSTINIRGGTISECSTTLDTGKGGGLYAEENSIITISGGTIENNEAARGGGVALTNSTVTDEEPIRNWMVVGNKAYKTGGGIWLGEKVEWDISDRTKQIYNNQAIEQGADIFLEGGTSAIKLPNAANMGAKYHDSGINIDNWYNDNPRYTPSESGQVVEANKLLNGGLSLVASYKADPVRIEIDANGGVGGSGSQTVQKGTTVTLEAPTKEGHLFKGWKDEKGNSYPAGEDGKVNITVTGDMTLTAEWKKLPSAENLPKTGDESPVLLWGAALAVSAAACFMLRRRK